MPLSEGLYRQSLQAARACWPLLLVLVAVNAIAGFLGWLDGALSSVLITSITGGIVSTALHRALLLEPPREAFGRVGDVFLYVSVLAVIQIIALPFYLIAEAATAHTETLGLVILSLGAGLLGFAFTTLPSILLAPIFPAIALSQGLRIVEAFHGTAGQRWRIVWEMIYGPGAVTVGVTLVVAAVGFGTDEAAFTPDGRFTTTPSGLMLGLFVYVTTAAIVALSSTVLTRAYLRAGMAPR